jgi:hypothetical protein
MVIDRNIDEWWQGLLGLGWLDTELDFAVLKAFAFRGVERAKFEGCKIWLLPQPSSVAFLASSTLSCFVSGNEKRMVLEIPQAWNFPSQSCLECLSVALVVVDKLV